VEYFSFSSFNFSLKYAISLSSWLKTAPMAKPLASHFTWNVFMKIWQHKDCLLCNLSSQQIETLLSLFHPVKIFMSFLHCIHHCFTNSTKIPDEFSVETSQSMKILTSNTFLGDGQFLITSTLSGSILNSFAEITKPK
jgi:hypothetical protein